jgi:hypothetical protein
MRKGLSRWAIMDSNHRPPACEAGAGQYMLASYLKIVLFFIKKSTKLLLVEYAWVYKVSIGAYKLLTHQIGQ